MKRTTGFWELKYKELIEKLKKILGDNWEEKLERLGQNDIVNILKELEDISDKIKKLLGLNTENDLPAGWEKMLVTKSDLVDAVNNAKITEANKYRNFINPNDLRAEAKKAGWEYRQEDLVNAANIVKEEAEKKQREFANKIKTLLGLDISANLPTDWNEKLVKKSESSAIQKELEEWTREFPEGLKKTKDKVDDYNLLKVEKETQKTKLESDIKVLEEKNKKINKALNEEESKVKILETEVKKLRDRLDKKPSFSEKQPDFKEGQPDFGAKIEVPPKGNQ